VRDHFKPEFLNRVDELIVFHRLDREHLARIVELQLDILQARLGARNIELQVTEDSRTYLARKGYDPAYGARPLKRLLQKEILDPLALKLLEGEFSDGDVVSVTTDGDGLAFRPAR